MQNIIIASFSFLLLIGCQKEQSKKDRFDWAQGNFEVKFSPIKPDFLQKIKPDMTKFYQENYAINDISGGFLVAKNGQILFEKYEGYANFQMKSTITPNKPLHIASISKVMTASVVLRLIDQGFLQLDESISRFFPKFKHKDVTVKTLLNHRSGLPIYAYFTANDTIWNHEKLLQNKDVIRLIIEKNIPLLSKPNTKFTYSNTNYVILALIIEEVTGLTYPKAMEKILFKPLGMTNTFVFEMDKHQDKVSESYKSQYMRIADDFLDAIYGDKNIYSTPRDILKFDLALYSDNFLSKTLRESMFRGYSYENKGIKNYGLGIRLREWENGQKMYYHNGWWHGNTSAYVTLRNDSVTLIALSNKYSRQPYQIKRLSSLFGDYPFKLFEDEVVEE